MSRNRDVTLWTPQPQGSGAPPNSAPPPPGQEEVDWQGWGLVQSAERPYGWAKGTAWTAGVYLVQHQIAVGMFQVTQVSREYGAGWSVYADMEGTQRLSGEYMDGPSIMVVYPDACLVKIENYARATLMHSSFGPEPQWFG